MPGQTTRPPLPPLLLITDRRQARLPLPAVIERALAAGCRWVSLREKDLDAAQVRALAAPLLPLIRRHGARLSVHADPHAMPDLIGACDGWHLPGGPGIAQRLRAARLAAPGALIGVSCHDAGDLEAANGADYVTLSPLFPSASKPGYGPALGVAGLARLIAGRPDPAPVLALGGITPATAAACRAAGAVGIALMGGVMRADDPGAEVASLLRAWHDPESSAGHTRGGAD